MLGGHEMKLRLSLMAAALCAVFLASPVSALADSPPGFPGAPVRYYLSLGDSLAAGGQPTLPPGQRFGDEGYADQLYALEQGKIANLQLVKMGCGGETTASMITAVPTITVPGIGPVPYEGRGDHFFCSFPHGSQLAEAVSFLHAHSGLVSFVTIDIGPNDVFQLGSAAGRAQIKQNLPLILAALRDAAGPGVPVIGMNFYDPDLVVWFSDPAALGPEVASILDFNNLLEQIYAAAGDPVADVQSAFSTTVTTPVNGTPVDVSRICQWTWMCAPPPLGPDIHANTAGYGVIAQAFEKIINV
jgi:lysophospholipase L1-like esterase